MRIRISRFWLAAGRRCACRSLSTTCLVKGLAVDVSGLFSDGGDRGAKGAPEGPPRPADPGRDGQHERPTHLQAVSAGSGEADPDQARRLLQRIADEADSPGSRGRWSTLTTVTRWMWTI